MRITNVQILFLLVVLALISTLISGVFNETGFGISWWSSLSQNFATELFGAITTFVLIEILLRRSQQKSEENERFVAAVNSQNSQKIVTIISDQKSSKYIAAGLLRNVNWSDLDLSGIRLLDYDLVRADFSRAIGNGIEMRGCNMEYCIFSDALFETAALVECNLRRCQMENINMVNGKLMRTNLTQANLQRGVLTYVDMHQAILALADLRQADLSGANLAGANLRRANLENARLDNAQFDNSTILPDGENWTFETEMSRFTDPSHEDFYRSFDRTSPAFKFKSE